jgi:hypothetical protein
MNIRVNEYYIHENNLVQVRGARGMQSLETLQFLIEWKDNDGNTCTSIVKEEELSAAPSLPDLYRQYHDALEAVCKQANMIEALEARQITNELITLYNYYQETLADGFTFTAKGPPLSDIRNQARGNVLRVLGQLMTAIKGEG